MSKNPKVIMLVLDADQIKPLTSEGNTPAQVSPTIDEQVIEQVQRQLGTGDDE